MKKLTEYSVELFYDKSEKDTASIYYLLYSSINRELVDEGDFFNLIKGTNFTDRKSFLQLTIHEETTKNRSIFINTVEISYYNLRYIYIDWVFKAEFIFRFEDDILKSIEASRRIIE